MCWDIGRADTALEDTGPVGTGRRSDTGSADTVPADIAHQSGTARRHARRTEESRPRPLPPDGKGAASSECLLEAFYTHFAPAARLSPGCRRVTPFPRLPARHALMWHFVVQLPLVSKAAPPAWWHAPQDVLAVSAVLCIAAFQFNGAFASCGQFAGWQVLHSFFSRLACAV